MVSTRGPKFKFSEGERVLCYEPDPTKAKVLYDSKVLEVKVSKDQRGRKGVEFLIHFQGWNSSWDRCVTEDYILKDTEENRQLQKDLAHKAQLQLCSNYRRGAYLYRRDRTKRHRKLSDRINDSLERQKGRRRASTSATSNSNASGTSVSVDSDQNSSSQDEDEEEDGSAWDRNSTDDSSGVDDEVVSDEAVDECIALNISSGLKRLLEHDFNLITKHRKLLKLPAEPNVVSILEGYVKHCAANQLCNSHTAASTASKNGHSNRFSFKYLNHNKTRDVDSICRNLNLCKEVVDGLRVYFDFTLGQLLLYSQEHEQHEAYRTGSCLKMPLIQNIKKEYDSAGESSTPLDECKNECVNEEENDLERDEAHSSYHSPGGRNTLSAEESNITPGRKRSLRSSHRPVPERSQVVAANNGVVPTDPVSSHISSVASNSSHCSTTSPAVPLTTPGVSSPRSNAVLSQVMSWHLVPPNLYEENPVPPALMYGATHLARLFVRLPDLVHTGTMPSKKVKLLTSHIETFMAYLEEHTEWFAEHNYKDNPAEPADS